MSQVNKIRVLVADDHPVVRTGLVLMIKYEPDIETVGEASNGIEAVELFRIHQPDIMLMDLRMPQMDGVEAITLIRQEFPTARIIVLTTYDGDENIYRGLQAGAKGYVLKGTPCTELLEAIRIVHAGEKYIPMPVAAKLAERLEGSQLTHRELQVLQLIAEGKSNLEIGKVLCISEGTVKYHTNNILGKLGVSDRTQAVIVALRRGIATL